MLSVPINILMEILLPLLLQLGLLGELLRKSKPDLWNNFECAKIGGVRMKTLFVKIEKIR